ncbi:hypothetical protein IMG5_063620 [Ichthyophthirius multifiliis]|uniref:protein-tyrosine-phosphatase n=1 Tax=Ichthyophthirius multifiliis TaxID=5932 RepID=G0QP34_ICHMU|nr:hypothetical protein IMG5_063620 [Ichthyophthirius multifiliis]EGR33021.1 hypothetical protein IMG5_063620 [Ichthyophthirius multifiliis]|eukprot:XP_004037007.1 hypothetical protein IMG5_063620 [Ichthyophthirius multifiliis]
MNEVQLLKNEQKKKKKLSTIFTQDGIPNKIVENLYLGSVGSAWQKNSLIQHQIKYVLTILDCQEPVFPDIIEQHKIIRVYDNLTQNIIQYFDESVQENKNVLVHCYKGKSRSASISKTPNIANISKYLETIQKSLHVYYVQISFLSSWSHFAKILSV